MKYSFYILIFCLQLSCAESNELAPAKPNIVLLLSDDQGWGDLSVNGNDYVRTPYIDGMAQNGATFQNFFVSPVCSPTRAEILTGRYAVRGGVYGTSEGGERLDLDETTIAEVFQKNGYKTAAYGKWHNGMQYPYHPNGRGFEDFYGYCSGHWGNYFSPVLERNGQLVRGEGFLTDDLTNKALEFIEVNKDSAFFLYLPFNTPHNPMQIPDEWWDKHKDRVLNTHHRFSEIENQEHSKAVYALCENIDWNVGRILEKLSALNLEENTIVIYMSDNGPNGWRWNGGMKGKKADVDEGGVRSPFFIQWEGQIEKGKRITEIAAAIDLLPTLADLAGIDYQFTEKLDGVSLKPLLLNEVKGKWPDRMIASFWADNLSIRDQDYRLSSDGVFYDMVNDFTQTKEAVDISDERKDSILKFKKYWIENVLSELPALDDRRIPIGHPSHVFYQLPARDAVGHGNIQRSNRWPNCSFFTNWISTSDSITWEIEVLEPGSFDVEVYYTSPIESLGSEISLRFKDQYIRTAITRAHDPPFLGIEKDRVERGVSYVKDFIPLKLGTIQLEKGSGTLVLKSDKINGGESIDFRLMMLARI